MLILDIPHGYFPYYVKITNADMRSAEVLLYV